ncbi:MAG: phosphoglycerate kinase [Anaerolineae bacterium]|nr:phosphoglycerate kinase [Anaerolineae bacterium]
MNKKTVTDIDVKGKKAFVRVDFNVPLSSKDPKDIITVTDDTRIRAALPTLNYLLDHGAALILASHLGRPKTAEDVQFAMKPVAQKLEEVIGRPVKYIPAVMSDEVKAAAAALKPGDILLLENTRFHPGEKKNDPQLSADFASLADVYVDDAFGSAHRPDASVDGAAYAMRAKGGPAVSGFLMNAEISALGIAVENPPRPYVAIMGGAKISDKIKLIENLLDKADKILIGGGMANTFLKAQGHNMGKSLVEEEALPEARRLLEMAADRLILPVDVVTATEVSADAPSEVEMIWALSPDAMALDIGPATLERFNAELQGAQLVIWNGPMGVFEVAQFANGTNQLAQMLAAMVDHGAKVIIGGGDSAAAVRKAGLTDKMTHVSTGGGASLELLEGRQLPGVVALDGK